MRDSFIFYRSFLKSIQHLDTTEQLELFVAIVEYGLDQREPEMSRYVRAVWESIKPQLDANQRKYENGCKGGKPKPNQKLTTPEPKPNQDLTKTEPKANQSLTTPEPPRNLMYNDNGNDNGNDKENEFNIFWSAYPRKTKAMQVKMAKGGATKMRKGGYC